MWKFDGASLPELGEGTLYLGGRTGDEFGWGILEQQGYTQVHVCACGHVCACMCTQKEIMSVQQIGKKVFKWISQRRDRKGNSRRKKQK